jgi:hypothetical protein
MSGCAKTSANSSSFGQIIKINRGLKTPQQRPRIGEILGAHRDWFHDQQILD